MKSSTTRWKANTPLVTANGNQQYWKSLPYASNAVVGLNLLEQEEPDGKPVSSLVRSKKCLGPRCWQLHGYRAKDKHQSKYIYWWWQSKRHIFVSYHLLGFSKRTSQVRLFLYRAVVALQTWWTQVFSVVHMRYGSNRFAILDQEFENSWF